jgi:hypothetical protein
MTRRVLLRLLPGIPALLLVILVVAEKTDALRSDTLVAAACTLDLLAPSPDIPALLREYRDVIARQAAEYDLPPEMLAAVIYGHQVALTPFRTFTDCAGSAIGRDLSLGLAQVRISTAFSADRVDPEVLANADFKQYRKSLLDPDANIGWQARVVRLLLDREIRYPAIPAGTLVHDPFAMALVMSEYRAGPQHTEAADSRLSGNAFFDLGFMLRDEVFIFGRPLPEQQQIQQEVRGYLNYIYCDSGIYNTSVCDNWQARNLPPLLP